MIFAPSWEVWLLTVFIAVLLDVLVGDPRWLPHPVRAIGAMIAWLDREWNLNRKSETDARKPRPHRPYDMSDRMRGVALTCTVVGSVFLLVLAGSWLAHSLHTAAGIAFDALVLFTTLAARSLQEAALEVARPLSEQNTVVARKQLGMIVGRDTERLEEPEIVRGTVETVAENTVDGVTSPLFWYFVGGAPLAMAYRAVNTLDSMVGYRNERYTDFGWASARLDDVFNWLPARLTACTMWLAACSMSAMPSDRFQLWPRGTVFKHLQRAVEITRRDARKHPSPNAGWPESMTAGLLGVQLGGTNSYRGVISERARLGDPLRPLRTADIYASIRIMHGAWIWFLTGLIGLAVFWRAMQ